MDILRCMGSKFSVKFQRAPLKFHTKFWTHTPQNIHFTVFYFCAWVTISLNCVVISLSETGLRCHYSDNACHLTPVIYITAKYDITAASHQWASYQIRKIAGCACAGNAGNVFPRRRFQRKPIVSDPGMHHGTCVTHVPWCMSGSLTCGDGENVPAFPAHAHPQFYVSGKRPIETALIQIKAWCRAGTSHYLNQCWPCSRLHTYPSHDVNILNGISST